MPKLRLAAGALEAPLENRLSGVGRSAEPDGSFSAIESASFPVSEATLGRVLVCSALDNPELGSVRGLDTERDPARELRICEFTAGHCPEPEFCSVGTDVADTDG